MNTIMITSIMQNLVPKGKIMLGFFPLEHKSRVLWRFANVTNKGNSENTHRKSRDNPPILFYLMTFRTTPYLLYLISLECPFYVD